VRQALNHAIDLGPLLSRFFEGRARRVAGICNGVWENRQLAPYNHNPQRAQALLEAAGLSVRDGRVHDGPEQFFLSILTMPPQLGTAEYIAGELQRIGIASSITSVAPSDVGQVLRQGPNFGLIVGHISGSATGVGELRWVDARFRPDLPPGVLSADSTFQRALDALPEVPTLDTLRDRVMDLQKDILEDAPWLFLYRLPRYTAHRSGITGLSVLPSGELILDNARIVSIGPTAPPAG